MIISHYKYAFLLFCDPTSANTTPLPINSYPKILVSLNSNEWFYNYEFCKGGMDMEWWVLILNGSGVIIVLAKWVDFAWKQTEICAFESCSGCVFLLSICCWNVAHSDRGSWNVTHFL